MSIQLTAEQQRRIEENRRKALERRAQRLGQTTSSNAQSSAGSVRAPVQASLSKRSATPDPDHRETPAPKRFVPPLKKESQIVSNQNQCPNHQQLSAGTGSQINQTSLYNSASSKQVRSLNLLSFAVFTHTMCSCIVSHSFADSGLWLTSSGGTSPEQPFVV